MDNICTYLEDVCRVPCRDSCIGCEHNNTKEKLIEKIKKEYLSNDICMAELLLTIDANGLSIAEAFELFADMINWANGDEVKVDIA